MTNYEAIPPMVQRFDEAIYGLAADPDASIAALAKSMIEKIGSKELPVAADPRVSRYSPVTRFDLMPVPNDPAKGFMGVFIVNPSELLSVPKEQIQADLVRTLEIARQFPTEGFERRMLTVYTEALTVQERWLVAHDIPEFTLDPRKQTKTAIASALLGKERYYTDTGFEDWQTACDQYVFTEPMLLPTLQKLRENRTHFLAVRQQFAPMLYQVSTSAMGVSRVHEMPRDELAKTTAYALMGISLGPPGRTPPPIRQ